MATQDFTDIAPYPESQLKSRINQLIQDRELQDALAVYKYPRMPDTMRSGMRPVIKRQLKKNVRGINTRKEWNNLLASFVKELLEETAAEFTYSGLNIVPVDQPCIFLSNHRDITLDPILVNYALWLNERPTTQIAIGDNLLSGSFETEFMRINNSFIVNRSSKGPRAQYAAMQKTALYISQTLKAGQSVWIAQREGRAKDGIDKTEPAILKMFSLAFEKDLREANHLVNEFNIVPTSLSYELDPCAPLKAREMCERKLHGTYQKVEGEDRWSIALGLMGYKGRIHVNFAEPIKGRFSDFTELANRVDESINSGRKQFGTFQFAAELLAGQEPSGENISAVVLEQLRDQITRVNDVEASLLLEQYRNQFTA